MTALPLPALVGLDAAQQALLLLAVEPRLRGIVLAAPAGAGKSSLARGLRALLGAATPFVELPPASDEENLLGGLDVEATVRAGRRVARPGLLARADGGIVYVDGLNQLPDATANLLLATLDSGEVRVEREGLSLRAPARFSLVASYDPAEGAPRAHLADRLALLVALPGMAPAPQRAEVVRRNLQPPDGWDIEMEMLRAVVEAAREQLPQVAIRDEQIARLCATAQACGVEGQRADLFAVYAAQAAAALALRDEVTTDDLEVAARLVLLPRATRLPAPAEAPPPPPAAPPPSAQAEAAPDEATEPPSEAPAPIPEEQLLAPLTAALPAELDALPFRHLRRGRSGSRGTTEGKRGRHLRSTPGDPRRAHIDIAATLRAAAPWQRLRPPSPHAPEGHDARRVRLQPSDLRVKHFRSKAGALFLFAVDASGSMALHRMRQAKGALHALLQRAYVHRDRVALIAFRGSEAELLLPPSQSVELARRALDALPTGGGTPLASALRLALEVAGQARSRGIQQAVLVLLTDGRANVSARAGADVGEELQALGRHLAASDLRIVVVDTQRHFLSRGEARQLAAWLGATYAYLPQASGEQIAAVAREGV